VWMERLIKHGFSLLPFPSQVQIRWVSCSHSNMSAVELRLLSGGQRALLFVREHVLELEGVFDHERELRWSKDSYVRILRPEIPTFLEGVIRQMRRR